MVVLSKYSCVLFLFVCHVLSYAQPGGPQAIVTIVGDPVQSNDNFLNNDNPYADNNTNGPPSQSQIAGLNNESTIEPTLENGFHARFELQSPAISERISSSGYMSSGSSGGAKVRKNTATLSERSFNAKKKIKTWLPKRKKKYRPHLCGRF